MKKPFLVSILLCALKTDY